MDPNFVQHSIVDISGRFLGYLVCILAYSVALNTVCNKVLFGTPWWEKTIGDGWTDDAGAHHPSKYIPGIDPGTYIIIGLGIMFAIMLDWNLFFYVGGVTNTQFALSMGERAADGSPSAWFEVSTVILWCNIITGAMAGLGRAAIQAAADDFAQGRDYIMSKVKKGEAA